MIFTAHHPRALDVPNQAVNVRLPQPCTQKQTVSTVQQSRHMETLGGHATQLHIARVSCPPTVLRVAYQFRQWLAAAKYRYQLMLNAHAARLVCPSPFSRR